MALRTPRPVVRSVGTLRGHPPRSPKNHNPDRAAKFHKVAIVDGKDGGQALSFTLVLIRPYCNAQRLPASTLAQQGTGGTLTFKWQERGRPPVAPPTWFGTSPLKATFPDAHFAYAVERSSCEMDVSISRAEDRSAADTHSVIGP